MSKRALLLQVAMAAFVVLPFCSSLKIAPIASFPGEWLAGLTAILLIIVAPSAAVLSLPRSALVFLVLPLLAALRYVIQPVGFAAPVILFLIEAATAMALAISAGNIARYEATSIAALNAAACGLIAAGLFNCVAVVLEQAGYHIELWHLYPSRVPSRALGLIGQPNQLALVTCLAWLGMAHLRLVGRIGNALLWLGTVALAYALGATASRAGWVEFVVAAGVIHFALACRPPEQGRDSRAEYVGFWGACAIVVLVQIAFLVMSHGPDSALARTTSSQRMEQYRDAWLLFAHHPLLGVGLGQFAPARVRELTGSAMEFNTIHPHNLEMDLLAEWGLVGLAVAVMSIGPVLLRTLRVARAGTAPRSNWLLPFGVVLSVLAYAQFEYPLWYAWFLLPFAFFLGFLPQPGVRLPVSPSTARWGKPAIALIGGLLLTVLALDWHRLSRVYGEVERQVQASTTGRFQVDIGIAQIASATFFPVAANIMFVRAMDPNGFRPDFKADLACKVFYALPNPESAARCVQLDLAAGRANEAAHLLDMLHARSPGMYATTAAMLAHLAVQDPRLTAYLRQRPDANTFTIAAP